MRDLILLALLVSGCLWTLRKPWIGVIMWAVVSLMSPHVEFGWRTDNWPVGLVVALSVLLGLLFTREKRNPFIAPPVWWLAAFTVWICITLPMSMYLDRSLPLWERSMKIYLMIFVTLALVDSRKKLDVFIWAVVIAVGFYGVKGGVFTLLTAGKYRVWGPGGFIGGNNELALALVMTIPLMRYLQLQMSKRLAVWAMHGAMALTAVTVLGTYSRGAFLAIVAMAFFLWAKGHNKLVWGPALLVVGAIVMSFMPEHWWDRMETISTYESDASALGRINAWWMAWNLAQDKFFGGGFIIYLPEVFLRYSPDPARVHAAHSIYFQVLGEHGFVGLFIFLLIGVTTWWCSRQLIRAGKSHAGQRWAAELGAMVQVAMVGYAVGGAFLSLAYFDLPYNLMVMVVVASYLVKSSVVNLATAQGGTKPSSASTDLKAGMT